MKPIFSIKGGHGSGIRGHRTIRVSSPTKRTKKEEERFARNMAELKKRKWYKRTFASVVRSEMGLEYSDFIGRKIKYTGTESELRTTYYVWRAHIRFAIANGVKVPDNVLQDLKRRSRRPENSRTNSAYDPKKNVGVNMFFKIGNARSGNRGHEGIPGHRGGSKPRGSGYVSIDEEKYKTLSATNKVKALKECIGSYKSCYTPKIKQRRAISKLSDRGKKKWKELNTSIGKLEGMRRAMIGRGDASIRVEQRKHYHFAIKLQEMAMIVKKDIKKLK